MKRIIIGLALALLGASAEAAPVVYNGMRAVMIGDSITSPLVPPDDATSGYGGGNAWWQPLANVLLPAVKPSSGRSAIRGAGVSGRRAKLANGARAAALNPGVHLDLVAMAYPSQTIQVVSTHITSGELAAYRPDIVFYLCGRNDFGSAIPVGTSQTYFDASMAAIRSYSATIPIVVLSVLTTGNEQVSGGNWVSWGAGPLNTMLQADSANYQATYVDVVGAWLTYEIANNTPAPGVIWPILTRDGTHPIAAGKLLTSQTVLSALTVK